MDPGLKGKFWISETITDIKKVQKYYFNIFKSYENFESLKGVAQILSPPRPFVFWTQNGHYLANFGVTKKFKKSKFTKKIFQLGSIYFIFALECTVLAQINKVWIWLWILGLHGENFPHEGPRFNFKFILS